MLVSTLPVIIILPEGLPRPALRSKHLVSQELQRSGGPEPVKLYVSAARAPSLAAPEHDLDRTAPQLHVLPPEDFWPAFERRYDRIAELVKSRSLASSRAVVVMAHVLVYLMAGHWHRAALGRVLADL